MTEIKQFGQKSKPPVEFMIDDDKFFATPEVPAGTMLDLLDVRKELRAAQGSMAERFKLITDIFETLLLPDSYTLFEERLRSTANPIGLETIFEVIQWMLGEAYAMRPTQLPSLSPDTPSSDGTSSTDGAPAEESILETSLGDGI